MSLVVCPVADLIIFQMDHNIFLHKDKHLPFVLSQYNIQHFVCFSNEFEQ
jgi:hypothetical protein